MNNDLKDYASNADMIYGVNTSFCPDRFNNSNSAINFENGYNSLPKGVYFNGDFAITVWINYSKFSSSSRILEFSNNKNKLVAVYFSDNKRSYPNIKTLIEDEEKEYIFNVDFNANVWHHLVITLCGNSLRLYVNGHLDLNLGSKTKLLGINSSSNYIGGNLNAKLDELRIYDRCISQNEIMNLMNLKN